MNKKNNIPLLCLFILFVATAQAQCPDFTDLHAPGVVCQYGYYSYPFSLTGVAPNHHKLISEQGTDPYTHGRLPLLPPGESAVIRLGNDNVGAQAEAITYTFTVDPSSTILLIKFAVVLEDPRHDAEKQPQFVVRVLNSHDELIEPCTEYNVSAGSGIPGFISEEGSIIWRPWTTIGVPLQPYIGQEIKLQFITYDCRQFGHFGYAYFTARCVSDQLYASECTGSEITLNAPDNFESYLWSTGDTGPSTTVSVGNEDTSYQCTLTSLTGCQYTLNAHISGHSAPSSIETDIYDTICQGESYHAHNFILPEQNSPGTFIFENTYFNPTTCSEEVSSKLHLTITPRYVTIYDEACYNKPYDKFGFHFDALPLGEIVDTTHNPASICTDTILIINVSTPYTDIFDYACWGMSYDGYGVHYDEVTKNITDTIFSPESCTGTILHLTLSNECDIYASICEGESYHENGFHIENPAVGLILDTLFVIDSSTATNTRAILHLTVRPTGLRILGDTHPCRFQPTTYYFSDSLLALLNIEECHWEISSSTNTIDQANGSVFSTVFGMDTPDTLILTVSGATQCGAFSDSIYIYPEGHDPFIFYDTICSGDSYTEHNFSIPSIDTTGLYRFVRTETSPYGCNDIYIVSLFVADKPDLYILGQKDILCEDEDLELHVLSTQETPTNNCGPANVCIGDILCTDGSIEKATNWPCGKTALGVVFHVDETGEHGFAVHLHNQGDTSSWGPSIPPAFPQFSTARQAIHDLDGQGHTAALAANNAGSIVIGMIDVANGWFLPSAGQLNLLYSQIPILNSTLSLVRGSTFSMYDEDWYYWSSSCQRSNVFWAIYYDGGFEPVSYIYPNSTYKVRSIRAF